MSEVVSLWAVDPGGFTGWCWAAVDVELFGAVDGIALVRDRYVKGGGVGGVGGSPSMGFAAGCVKTGGVDGFLRFARMVEGSREAALRFVPEASLVRTVVVAEGFQLLPGAKSQSVQLPVRWLAYLDLYRKLHPGWCDDVETQLPAEKGIITNERLKRWGLWYPQKDTRDAIRHMCVRLRKFLDTA